MKMSREEWATRRGEGGSLGRTLRRRERYAHVSKPLKTIKINLAGIEIVRTIVDPVKGTQRFTNKEAFERLGKMGTLYA